MIYLMIGIRTIEPCKGKIMEVFHKPTYLPLRKCKTIDQGIKKARKLTCYNMRKDTLVINDDVKKTITTLKVVDKLPKHNG